jgi:hypothetical protein
MQKNYFFLLFFFLKKKLKMTKRTLEAEDSSLMNCSICSQPTSETENYIHNCKNKDKHIICVRCALSDKVPSYSSSSSSPSYPSSSSFSPINPIECPICLIGHPSKNMTNYSTDGNKNDNNNNNNIGTNGNNNSNNDNGNGNKSFSIIHSSPPRPSSPPASIKKKMKYDDSGCCLCDSNIIYMHCSGEEKHKICHSCKEIIIDCPKCGSVYNSNDDINSNNDNDNGDNDNSYSCRDHYKEEWNATSKTDNAIPNSGFSSFPSVKCFICGESISNNDGDTINHKDFFAHYLNKHNIHCYYCDHYEHDIEINNDIFNDEKPISTITKSKAPITTTTTTATTISPTKTKTKTTKTKTTTTTTTPIPTPTTTIITMPTTTTTTMPIITNTTNKYELPQKSILVYHDKLGSDENQVDGSLLKALDSQTISLPSSTTSSVTLVDPEVTTRPAAEINPTTWQVIMETTHEKESSASLMIPKINDPSSVESIVALSRHPSKARIVQLIANGDNDLLVPSSQDFHNSKNALPEVKYDKTSSFITRTTEGGESPASPSRIDQTTTTTMTTMVHPDTPLPVISQIVTECPMAVSQQWSQNPSTDLRFLYYEGRVFLTIIKIVDKKFLCISMYLLKLTSYNDKMNCVIIVKGKIYYVISFLIILDNNDIPRFDSFLTYKAKPYLMNTMWDLADSNLVVPFILLKKMGRPIKITIDWSNDEDTQ